MQVDSGTTVRRRLIGFTPEAFDELRAGQASDEQQLDLRQERIENLLRIRRGDSLSLLARDEEIQRLRIQLATTNRQLTKQELATGKALGRPLQKPMLLDPNFYKGFGLGYLAGLATPRP